MPFDLYRYVHCHLTSLSVILTSLTKELLSCDADDIRVALIHNSSAEVVDNSNMVNEVHHQLPNRDRTLNWGRVISTSFECILRIRRCLQRGTVMNASTASAATVLLGINVAPL